MIIHFVSRIGPQLTRHGGASHGQRYVGAEVSKGSSEGVVRHSSRGSRDAAGDVPGSTRKVATDVWLVVVIGVTCLLPWEGSPSNSVILSAILPGWQQDVPNIPFDHAASKPSAEMQAILNIEDRVLASIIRTIWRAKGHRHAQMDFSFRGSSA